MAKVGGKTLQEICDMPRQEGIEWMRNHGFVTWQASPSYRYFDIKVELEISKTDTERFQVQARTKQEAMVEAEEYIKENFEYDDYEILEIK